jgi:2,3-bisphosphoglycerate-dependent phosphoglycerate mutase
MDPGATRLLLIRHAHVDTGEDDQRMCGWLDLPLSPTGERQLQCFRNQPSDGFRFKAVYTSSSLRARVTAKALVYKWNLPVTIDPQLREISCGACEGMPVAEVQHRYPELWAENASQGNSEFSWPKGESYTNFRRRVFQALSRIAGRNDNARIPVVTHAGVISQVLGAMKGLSPAVWEQYRPGPFTATEVIWRGEAPVDVLSFNLRDWWRGLQPHAA